MLIHYYDLTAGVKKGASRLLQREERRGLQRPTALVLCLGKEEDFCTWDVADCAQRKGCGADPCCLRPPALMM